MKNRKILIRGIVAACAMLVIILDTRTAVSSAADGIQLCLRTVIPSLFPFFVLSGVINSCLLGRKFVFLRPIGRLCKIPEGAESLLVLGLMAGYPVGAQLIAQSCETGNLSKADARRMLGFCSNAGPAFIFGILSHLFSDPKAVWFLWGIHILSALVTGCILPGKSTKNSHIVPGTPLSFISSLHNATRVMASVCGLIIVFRVILGYCNRWFLWLAPVEMQVAISGVVELANGCVLLQYLPQEGMRFLIAGTLLGFGGLCVLMQTLAVTKKIGTGWYFPGKVIQAVISFLLCSLVQPIIFDRTEAVILPSSVLLCIFAVTGIYIYCVCGKKVVAFRKRMLYNTGN